MANDYGLRPDRTPKGKGYFGEIKIPNSNKVATELSMGVEMDGKKMLIPSLVPTLTANEIDLLISGNKPTKAIMDKAVAHAKERLRQGKSPFAGEGEQLYGGNVRGQDIPYKKLSPERKRQLQSDVNWTPEAKKWAESLVPYMNPAVKTAEGNKNNFGVLSQQVKSPSHANQLLNQSIINNAGRWWQAGQPGTMVDFMRDRWAPIGVPNDPNNLNPNWNNNVRKKLFNILGPQEYERWKQMNLVQNVPWGGTV